MTERSKHWIQTATGRKFDVIDPSVVDVDILDIAHALSNLCRFTGHCAEFYSVAEHCVRVSFRCEELAMLNSSLPVRLDEAQQTAEYAAYAKHCARWGLLHDASEAYVNDLSRPLKHQPELKRYRGIEDKVMQVIAEKFDLGRKPPEVAIADDELLWTEARDIMSPMHSDWKLTVKTVGEPLEHVKIACWVPHKAHKVFLRRFVELFPEVKI